MKSKSDLQSSEAINSSKIKVKARLGIRETKGRYNKKENRKRMNYK